MRGNFHYHFSTGTPCYCGWGRGDLGHGLLPKVAGWQEEWAALRGRKKLQRPEMQRVLNHLEAASDNVFGPRFVNDDTVKWVPWIIQKLKDKEMLFGKPGNRPYAQEMLHYQHPQGVFVDYEHPERLRYNEFSPTAFQKTAQFLNSGHRLRQEIDPLKTSPQEMEDRIKQWEEDLEQQKNKAHRGTGEVLQAFPDGWTMRRLRPEEMEGEGMYMGNCVGSYGSDVQNGRLNVLSLRDPKGWPHVTTGIRHYPDDTHEPGQIWEHKGKGNEYPKPEYDEYFKKYFSQFPQHERPLSYDGDMNGDDIEDWRELENRLDHDNGAQEVGEDQMGLPTEVPAQGLPNLDLDDWHQRLHSDHYYNAYYPHNADTFMDYLQRSGRVGEYEEHVLQPAEQNFHENFDHYNPYGFYHPRYPEPLPASHPGMWDDEEWAHEFNRQNLGEVTDEAKYGYESDWEDAEGKDREDSMSEHPEYQAITDMYNHVNQARQQQQAQQQALQQPPQQMTAAQHDVTHPHYHYGYPCRCPWGAEEGGEHLGAIKEAAKLDWLRDRPDMQDDEGKAFLDKLEDTGYDEADKMLPWIIREYRKKRLSFDHPTRPDLHLSYPMPETGCYRCLMPDQHDRFCRHYPGDVQENQKSRTWFTQQHAKEWQETLQSMKNHRQGVDLMQHSVHELAPKVKAHQEYLQAKKREKAGRVAHKFEDGWTVRQLQNADECRWEGNEMGHCAGGYGPMVEHGDTILMSLRTPDNKPRGTLEIEPGHFFDPKEPMGEDNRWTSHERRTYEREHPDRKLVPHPEGGTVNQWFAREDTRPPPEYTQKMNEWLDQYGMDAMEPWGEDDDEFVPWWHDTYTVDGPRTVDEYIDEDGQEAPDEYYQACADAEHHDLEEPNLEYDPPDFQSIWEDHNGSSDLDEAKALRDSAAMRQELGEFHDIWTNQRGLGESRPDQAYARPDEEDENARQLDEWWRKEFAQHHNPDTGQWENPTYNYNYDAKPSWTTAVDRWWDRNQTNYPQLPGVAWQEEGAQTPMPQQVQQSIFSKFASENPPIYYRWALSPETGDVELGSNTEDHPALVPSHEDLAGRINRPNLAHGYAYRINGGWRLTDWEHRPIEDRFVTSQIMRALAHRGHAPEETQEPSWEPAAHDFDRLHHGLPQPAED